VTAKSVSARKVASGLQASAAPEQGLVTIGGDNEMGIDAFVVDIQAIRAQVDSLHAPLEFDAELFGSVNQQLLQHEPTNAETGAVGEVALDGGLTFQESHPSEGEAVLGCNRDAQLSKRGLGIGQ
jgi:hypothetical protein